MDNHIEDRGSGAGSVGGIEGESTKRSSHEPSTHDRSSNHSSKKRRRSYSSSSSDSSSDRSRRKSRKRSRRSSSSSSSDSSSSSSRHHRRHKTKKHKSRDHIDNDEMERRRKILEEEREKVQALVDATKSVGNRAGGVYIPPHRLALLKQQQMSKSGSERPEATEEYQRMTWEALRKSITGLVNKVTSHNIKNIIIDILKENLIRGRGLLCKSLMRSQISSPNFTPVYACLIAVINTKLPAIGELLIRRLLDQFKKGYRRKDKKLLVCSTKFLAHLVNQMVCGVVLPLQILLLLLEKPTNDSIEIAVSLMQEMGMRLSESSPQAFNGIFDQFRTILHEGNIDKRVEYIIEGLFIVRRNEFKDYPAITPELDIVEEADQITHEHITLDDDDDQENGQSNNSKIEEQLDYFKFDPLYYQHEDEYKEIVKEMLGSDDDDDGSDGSSDSSDESSSDEETAKKTQTIEDQTSSDVTILKRAIYLTIMSSRDHEEVVHKLLKMNLQEDQKIHVCKMVIQCCAQERTYLKFYGLIAERLCLVHRDFQLLYEQLFEENYMSIHRYENNPLRNVSRIFAHLLFTDALPWTVMQCIKLNERDTTASSRIFIKILFTDLVMYLGLERLMKRVQDPRLLHPFLEGLFPTNSPRDTKFAINFWTAIELGALTDQLRLAYNDMIKKIAEKRAAEAERRADGYSSSSSSSSSYSSSDGSSSSGYSSSSSSGSYSSSDSSSSSSSSSSRGRSRRRR